MRFTNLLLLATLALSACAAPATPAPPTPDIAATTDSIAGTIVAGTLTAQPTATPQPSSTPLPPTATATETPIPPTATITETPTPAASATAFIGTLAPYDVSKLPNCPFLIDNNTDYELIVTIYGTTKPGEKPVYYSWRVTNSFRFDIPWGSYQYTVQIGDKKTITGSFGINNYDKTTMRVSLQKVIVIGP